MPSIFKNRFRSKQLELRDLHYPMIGYEGKHQSDFKTKQVYYLHINPEKGKANQKSLARETYRVKEI